MRFEAVGPGFSVFVEIPFSIADKLERPELEGRNPRGFQVTFKWVRNLDDGKEYLIYDTDKDKRLERNPDKDYKKHVEKWLLEQIELGDRNFRVWTPPKEALFNVDEVKGLKEREEALKRRVGELERITGSGASNKSKEVARNE